MKKNLSKLDFKNISLLAGVFALSLLTSNQVYAQDTANSEFRQVIEEGTLQVRIVDGDYADVASPYVAMSNVPYSFFCQTSTGVFGDLNQRIYVENPSAADGGWSVSLAASLPTDEWVSATNPLASFDFNNPADSGCTGGQMTINPSVATLGTGVCASCGLTGITTGSTAAFNQGTVDSITLLTAAANSDDIGDWELTGVDISQTIPAETPIENDYAIDMVLTIVAS